MCFYFQLSIEAQTLENRFQRKFIDIGSYKSKAIINGFEHPNVPIILPNNLYFEYFEWGLIPFWAKDISIQKSTLNARIETINDKPSFKQVISNRCLIPATGFFEWQWLDEKGKEKQRYLIQINSKSVFSFAGLTSVWVDKNTGEIKNTFCILTTQANELMSEIHNTKKRMPVILKNEDEFKWLKGEDYHFFAHPYEQKLVAEKV